MKIAFIGQRGIPSISNGIEKHVEEISTRMAEKGHEVFAYVQRGYGENRGKIYKKVRLIRIPSIPFRHFDIVFHSLLSTFHAIFCKYDIVHYHGTGANLFIWLMKFYKPRNVLVSTFHRQDYEAEKWGFVAKMFLRIGERMTCKKPDRVISISKTLASHIKEKYGMDTVVIPNGAETVFVDSTKNISAWGLKDKNYILFVGKITKNKGAHYLVEAFKKLEDTSKILNNFKLVIVGMGDISQNDDYVRYFKTIVEGRENIIFMEKQPRRIMSELFSHAYLFIQPSESESSSALLLEAMGYGLAPLVSDIKENLECIGDCGYSFKTKNVIDLRDKLAYILNRPNEAKAAGMCVRGRIESEYGWDSITSRILEVYNNELEKKQKNEKR